MARRGAVGDAGVDLGEEGAGDIVIWMHQVVAIDNTG
jgi:hypothetical protein